MYSMKKSVDGRPLTGLATYFTAPPEVLLAHSVILLGVTFVLYVAGGFIAGLLMADLHSSIRRDMEQIHDPSYELSSHGGSAYGVMATGVVMMSTRLLIGVSALIGLTGLAKIVGAARVTREEPT